MRPRKINSPEEFLSLWDEYKEHVNSTPDKINKATNKGIQTEIIDRPYTRQGFEAYVYRVRGHHIHQYIDNYDNAYEEFLGVVTCARREWEENQISGTLTGKYKAPNLTARLNGLTERVDATTQGDKVNSIEITIVPPNEDNE